MSAQIMEERKAVNRRALPILPWLLLALTVILGGVSVFFWLTNQQGPDQAQAEDFYGGLLFDLTAIITGAVGALIVARGRRNPIGWVLSGLAFSLVMEETFGGYAAYGFITHPGRLPGALFFAWIQQWEWTPQFAAWILLLLLYPTGRLLSPRWRIVAWGGIVAVAALLLSLALSKQMSVGHGKTPLFLPNPIGVIDFGNFAQDQPSIFLFLVYLSVLVMLIAALISLILRFRRAHGDERQQLKWFTYAAAPMVVLVTLSVLSSERFGAWLQVVQNIAYLMLPLGIGVANLKYRLYEIDLLINRTLVYVPLTAILAGVFAASITLSQKLFIAITGTTSDAATVLTTLIVVALFDPLKLSLQHFVDKRFKDAPDPARKLKVLGDEMRAVLQVLDVEQMTPRVLEEAVTAFGAEGGAWFRGAEGGAPVQTYGEWKGNALLSVPLRNPKDGAQLGTFALGARRTGANYTAQDRATLQQIADLTARAMALDERAIGVRH